MRRKIAQLCEISQLDAKWRRLSAYIQDVSSTSGQRVRAARILGRLSREQLALALGMSVATLQRIETDDRALKRIELLGIAEACEVPTWFLESGFDEVHRSAGPDPVALADQLHSQTG